MPTNRSGSPSDREQAPKSAKDLLYLHDLMAAGPAVVDQIERDVATVAGGSPADADQVSGAASHLGLALSGSELGRHLNATVSMLMERQHAADRSTARAVLLGHLADLHDILTSATADGAAEASAPASGWEDDDETESG